VHAIKVLFDKIFVIFPFEVSFYKKHNVEVSYAGNPSYEAITKHLATHKKTENEKVIALLPGSRWQEVQKILPVYKHLVKRFPDWQFTVAGVSNLPESLYTDILTEPNVSIAYDKSFDILSHATAAVVASGTATFEAALLDVPQVVVYKTSWLTFLIAKMVIKIPYISLVNLVAEEEVVKELIQDNFNVANTENELRKIVPGSPGREAMLNKYQAMKAHLGPSNASERAAKEIVTYLTT
jgi:lipid-A-disaccharide synthase